MKHGFQLNHMLMDGQFDLADLQITLNTVSADKHVPKIERHIRTCKEQAHCVYNTLPFRKMTAQMIIEMVYSITFWLNSFPVSKMLSPRAIISGMQIDYAKHCKLEFGTYVQTHMRRMITPWPRTQLVQLHCSLLETSKAATISLASLLDNASIRIAGQSSSDACGHY
jgi:hypothetical protein